MSGMIVKVVLEDRPDGGVRVWSNDVPGLCLSGKDRTRIIAGIEPAIRAILRHKGIEPDSLRIDAILTPAEREADHG
jgi:hypothetical protein